MDDLKWFFCPASREEVSLEKMKEPEDVIKNFAVVFKGEQIFFR